MTPKTKTASAKLRTELNVVAGNFRKPRVIVLLIITAIAGWLRFTATSFGFPALTRPDEQFLVYPALHFRGGDWNPHFAVYPAAQMYVIHMALRAYATFEIGWANSHRFYEGDNYLLSHLVAREVSAAFGTATVPAIYYAAAPLLGVPAALTSAALLALSPIHVRDAKFATADIAAVFWITLAVAMCLRIATGAGAKYYILAGVFCGLAAATKYQAGTIVLAVAVAHVEAHIRRGRNVLTYLLDRAIYLAGACAILVFTAATPYFFLDWPQTRHDYALQMEQVTGGGFFGAGYAGLGWDWLLRHALPGCFGVGVEVLMLAALGWALLGRRRGAPALAAFVGFTFLVLSRSHLLYYRYLLVPLPALAILSGSLIADVANLIARRFGNGPAIGLTVAVLAVLLVPLLVDDIRLNELLLRTDTRVLARQWIDQHIPKGLNIAEIDNNTPYGKPPLSERHLTMPFESCRVSSANNTKWVLSDNYPPLFSRGPSAKQSDDLAANAALVFEVDPLSPSGYSAVYDAADAFYAPLRRVVGVARPGPRIRIWKIADRQNPAQPGQ